MINQNAMICQQTKISMFHLISQGVHSQVPSRELSLKFWPIYTMGDIMKQVHRHPKFTNGGVFAVISLIN